MRKLIQRLLKREPKPKTEVSFEEGLAFLRANGVDPTNIHFPGSQFLKADPIERYDCWFTDLNAKLVKNPKGLATTNIEGLYHSRAMLHRQDEAGNSYPGAPTTYKFSAKGDISPGTMVSLLKQQSR